MLPMTNHNVVVPGIYLASLGLCRLGQTYIGTTYQVLSSLDMYNSCKLLDVGFGPLDKISLA